jgi:Nif-specific regulatory protein
MTAASPSAQKGRDTGEFRNLSLLFEINQILDKSLDLHDVIDPVLAAIASEMVMDRATLTLVNPETGELVIDAAHGLSKSQLKRGRYKVGEGVTGQVVESGRPAIVPLVSKDPAFLDRTGIRREGIADDGSFICVPVKMGQEVIGTLSVDCQAQPHRDFEADSQLLSTIASMVSQAVKLRQEAQRDRQRLLDENKRLQEALKTRFRPSNIIGNARSMQAVYDMIGRVCKSDATVLVRGESGVGKELIAHALHYNSNRGSRPFIKVNCSALPQSVLESELFGHEAGAFTGAVRQRQGRFELAHSGTIFLDEIGDLAATTQVMLLRVLQEREFERVGGTQTLKVDVRIIAATNRNLEEQVSKGEFREDLYYRLNVVPIHVPPLRERQADIMLLADYFVERYSKANHKTIKRISTPAIDMLTRYHWPGNVRELENCIERAVLLSDDEVIHGHHLPPTLQTAEATGTTNSGTLQETLERIEREMIVDALKVTRGNMAQAARDLGLTERVMGLRVAKYDIDWRRFRAGV